MSSPLSIDTNKLCLAGLMKEAGYSTACIGKWHLGFGKKKTNWNNDLKPGPLELGLDYYYGVPQVNSGPPFVYVENHRVVGLDPDDPFVPGKEIGSHLLAGAASSKLTGRVNSDIVDGKVKEDAPPLLH